MKLWNVKKEKKIIYNKTLNNLTFELLIKKRFHFDFNFKETHKKMNSYIFGRRQNIIIYNIEKILWKMKYLFYNLTQLFFERNNFLIFATNQNIPFHDLINNFLTNINMDKSSYNKFILLGFLDKKWVNGIISNWTVIFKLISNLKKYIKTRQPAKKYKRLLYYLQGLRRRWPHPIVPDFILTLDCDKKGVLESIKQNIPLLGFVNKKWDPQFFLYPILGNSNSLQSVKFFLNFLIFCLKQSFFKEQELLYLYILKKIKKLLKYRYIKKVN